MQETPPHRPAASAPGLPLWQHHARYDPVGNRSSRARCGITNTYSYDQADRIQSASATKATKTVTVNYTLNADGNEVARGIDAFKYDQANRMTKSAVRQPTLYGYNGDGLRVQTNAGTGPFTTHVWDIASSLPLLLFDGNRKYVYGAAGLAYDVDGNGTLEVFHTDGLGSVRAVTYANGQVVQTYGTDEYGVPSADLTQGTSNQPMQYTGQFTDKETGFSYLRARYYDPNIGRFTQRDAFAGTIAAPLSLSRYVYAENSPLNLVDPRGRAARKSQLLRSNLTFRFGTDLTLSQEIDPGTSGIPDWVFNRALRAQEVAKQYGIDLVGPNGEPITIVYDPDLPVGQEGVTAAANPTEIRVGPQAFSDDETLARTIVHELNHARGYLSGRPTTEEEAIAAEEEFFSGGGPKAITENPGSGDVIEEGGAGGGLGTGAGGGGFDLLDPD